MYRNKRFIVVCLLGFTLFIGACSSDEEKKSTYYDEGRAFLAQGELEDAEQAFLKAISMDARYGDAYIKLGVTKMRQGDLRAALVAFSKAAEIDPQNIHVQLRLATFYMLGREFPKALNVLDAVLERSPDNTEALFLKGSLMAQKKSLHQARDIFQKIILLDSSQVRAYLALVKIKSLLGETDDLIPLLRTAMEHNPHALDPKLALVDRYLIQGKVAEAKAVLLDALQHDPGNPDLQGIMGSFYFRIGQMSMAESAYKEAVRLAPAELKPLMALARFYALTGDEEHAAASYAKGVELAPENVQVLDTVSRFYAHVGKADLAEKYVNMALEANPAFLPSRLLQMELALKQAHFDEVVQRANALVAQGKKLPNIYYLRGMAHLGKGESEKAEADLLHAVSEWPGHISARIGLARVFFSRNEYKKAHVQAKAVLALAPRNLDARLLLGSIADTQGDFNLADQYYRDALKINPGFGPAANNLAYLLVKQNGDLDEALLLARRALETMPEDLGVLDTLGWIYYKRGAFDAAAPLLAKSAASDPLNPVFSYHLGMVYLKQGKTLLAREALKQALGVSKEFIGAHEAQERLDELGPVEKESTPEESHGD